MSLENITGRFVELGLDQEEATVLRDLYLAGESKAGDLAKSSGLARIKVYRILERLQEMNIVESTMGRPVIFSAIPPDSAVEKLIEHAAKKLERMESAREGLMQELSRFKLNQKPQAEAKYRIVQGRQQIYSMIAKMIGAANSEILAYVERDDLMKMAYTDIPEELARARKRGAKVMILTDVDYSLAPTIKEYSEFADVRHTKIPGMSILLVSDDSELAVSAMTRADSSGDVALWMNGKNFVAGIRGLLSDSWENAVDAQARINIMKEGGKALEDILIVRGTRPISELYRGMLTRAKRHVLHVSVPYDTAFFDAIAPGVLADAKNAKVQIITSVDSGSLQRLRALEGCDIRHVDSKTGVNITLVDDEVMLTPAAGSRGQSAIWSSVRDYVEHYSTMFDNLWSSSAAMADRVAAVETQEKISKLLLSMRKLLEKTGKIRKEVKGASGLVHEFSLAASGDQGSVVVDVAGPETADPQAAVIGFLVKCMDIKADHKILVTLSDPSAVKAPAKSLQSDVTIVGADDAEEALRRIVARWQTTTA